jgi:hypothetical protein
MITFHAPAEWYWLRLQAFRGVCAAGTAVSIYTAAVLGELPHSGWLGGGLGLLAGLAFALTVREPAPSFLSCSYVPRGGARAQARLLVPATALLFAIVITPVLLTKLPAFCDYTNHLARMYIMSGQDSLLEKFYRIHWRVIPNLGIDLIIPSLAKAFGIFAAGKVFIVLYTLLLIAGPHAIYLALYRKASIGPLACVPFIYNYVSVYGLLNYEFSIGLALFAIAAWIALRESAPALRGLVSLACVIVLFFAHFMGLAIYGLTIGSFELWRMCSRPQGVRTRLIDAAALAMPFAAAIPLLLLGPEHPTHPIPVEWGGLRMRLEGLRNVVQAYFRRADLAAMLIMLAGFFWALRARILDMHPFGWIFLGVMVVVYLIIPNQAMDSWGAVVRFPIAAIFILTGVLHWELASTRARRVFLLVIVGLVVFRTAFVEVAFRRYDEVRADLESSLTLVAPGSRVLVAEDQGHLRPEWLIALTFLPCLAIIERSSLVSIAFAGPVSQILVVNPPFDASAGDVTDLPIWLTALLAAPEPPPKSDLPRFALSGRIYWADWDRTYDYVYILNRHGQPNPAPDRLELLFDGNQFQLFRVRRPNR